MKRVFWIVLGGLLGLMVLLCTVVLFLVRIACHILVLSWDWAGEWGESVTKAAAAALPSPESADES